MSKSIDNPSPSWLTSKSVSFLACHTTRLSISATNGGRRRKRSKFHDIASNHVFFIRVCRHPERVLTQEHYDYLTSQDTLIAWCGFSIRDRCILFHRKFPNKTISTKRLSSIYKRNNISNKVVRKVKKTPARSVQSLPGQVAKMVT